jgi:sugar phosphate isomerase/epimerase
MGIGLSTYAFFWQFSETAERPLTLIDMVKKTHQLGLTVFQICDYAPIQSMSDTELAEVRDVAESSGIQLELGTRGIQKSHLTNYLDIASKLDSTFLRTMLHTSDHKPSVPEAIALLNKVLPTCADRGVTIGLETYEQVSTDDLIHVVEGVGSPFLGVCLDPANSVARLELPVDVIDRTAPFVVNMHVKDFTFTRQAGWVGFSLIGCPLGEGLLDYDGMIAVVQPGANVNQVIEHWLPWQGTSKVTCQLEERWTQHNIDTLRSKHGY